MSTLRSSRLMARCWLTLALCVAAFWCHPVPDNSNAATTAAPRLSFLKVEEQEQSSEFADSDYADMMTDFLRLSTITPTAAASTESFLVNTQSTSTLPPSTSVGTTTKPSSVTNAPATVGVATTRFIPIVPTTTTTKKPITKFSPTPATIVETTTILPRVQEQTSAPAIATPVTSVKKLKVINKPLGLNEIEPSHKTVVQTKPTAAVIQAIANPSSPTLQKKTNSSPVTTQVQQSAKTQVAFNEQWKPSLPGSGKQQSSSSITPTTVFNQPQQQQMAVGGPTAIQQPNNQVQTAASNGPNQQQQVPNFAAMAVPNRQQYQPTMQNQAMIQQTMWNPAVQQQQFQKMYQNRVPSTAQATTTAKQSVKTSATILTPLANPLIGNNRRPVYFIGGNGTPAKLLPLSFLPQLMFPGVQTSPPSAATSV